MKKMLINITKKSRSRIALIENQKLYNFDVEDVNHKRKKSSVYKGKIIHIVPSLEAVFVDYGTCKNGFLPFREISCEYFFNKNITKNRYNIKNVLKKGQECIVQVNKEERGNKCALLTTFISLAGSYIVLFPKNPGFLGISRKISGKYRNSIKKTLLLLKVPIEMGIIFRTASLGKSVEILQIDLMCQLQNWKKIKEAYQSNCSPCLIYQENNIIFRALRDYLYHDIQEVIVDDSKFLVCIYQYISLLGKSNFRDRIKLYTGTSSLFSYYQIESQINSIFQRNIILPSGGSITIDTLEALTAIDINSFRSNKGLDIEETALSTNLEAANEISRQLRLRDLGGLIVIDFIDMTAPLHKRLVINHFRKILKNDRARIQIGTISKFGLLEMSRQRLNSSMNKINRNFCSKCNRF
ncbi:MAG: Rne/Rng family ribonuclease [Buchnera aphidicola (Schlechtendalia chinensis)]